MGEPQEEGWEEMQAEADSIIAQAEKELGLLTSGQRCDFLKDNTEWESGTCDELVQALDERDAERWRASKRAVSPNPEKSDRMADAYRRVYYRP